MQGWPELVSQHNIEEPCWTSSCIVVNVEQNFGRIPIRPVLGFLLFRGHQAWSFPKFWSSDRQHRASSRLEDDLLLHSANRASMNRSVEQALTSLIPRHNGTLPPELVELASSLLAQSRNNASNLKAEEEIGRTYACANIACERFATSISTHLNETNVLCAT
jgi:hypothetical protein